MSEVKLLPCPFCGGEAEFVRDTERKDIFGSSDYVYVRCKKCHAQTTKIYYSAEFHKLDEEYALAEKAWNTRKPMERIVERLKLKLKNICGSYNYETPILEKPSCKVAFNNGIRDAIEIVKEVGEIYD